VAVKTVDHRPATLVAALAQPRAPLFRTALFPHGALVNPNTIPPKLDRTSPQAYTPSSIAEFRRCELHFRRRDAYPDEKCGFKSGPFAFVADKRIEGRLARRGAGNTESGGNHGVEQMRKVVEDNER
jgi:hypothetical protein